MVLNLSTRCTSRAFLRQSRSYLSVSVGISNYGKQSGYHAEPEVF